MPTNQKVRAYLWLAFIAIMLAGANYLFFRFSFDLQNPFPLTRGLAFGSSLWSVVLLVAIALRNAWARYLLSSLLVFAMVCFGLADLMINTRAVIPLNSLTRNVVVALVLCAFALYPLGFSRSLRRFLAPRTAGGK